MFALRSHAPVTAGAAVIRVCRRRNWRRRNRRKNHSSRRSARKARTWCGCRRRRRWSTRCSTSPKSRASDYVIDLGSGDGRTVITAAKRGARALGIEYNPDMVELSKRNADKAGVTDKATFVKADLFESDFSQATVITMFLLPDINLKLRPKILDLKPGTRIVSNTFTMGEWTADETATVDEKDGCSYYCTAHLWIVPAKVEGTWQIAAGRAVAQAELPDGHRHAQDRRQRHADRERPAARRSNQFQRRRRAVHRPRQRQHDRGHGQGRQLGQLERDPQRQAGAAAPAKY